MTLTFEETRLVVLSHDLDLFVSLWCFLICSYIKGGFFKRLEILQPVCKADGKDLVSTWVARHRVWNVWWRRAVCGHWEILREEGISLFPKGDP